MLNRVLVVAMLILGATQALNVQSDEGVITTSNTIDKAKEVVIKEMPAPPQGFELLFNNVALKQKEILEST